MMLMMKRPTLAGCRFGAHLLPEPCPEHVSRFDPKNTPAASPLFSRLLPPGVRCGVRVKSPCKAVKYGFYTLLYLPGPFRAYSLHAIKLHTYIYKHPTHPVLGVVDARAFRAAVLKVRPPPGAPRRRGQRPNRTAPESTVAA